MTTTTPATPWERSKAHWILLALPHPKTSIEAHALAYWLAKQPQEVRNDLARNAKQTAPTEATWREAVALVLAPFPAIPANDVGAL